MRSRLIVERQAGGGIGKCNLRARVTVKWPPPHREAFPISTACTRAEARTAIKYQYPRERDTTPVKGRPVRNAATFCKAIGAADCGSVEAATWGSTVTWGCAQKGWSAGSGSLWKTSSTA